MPVATTENIALWPTVTVVLAGFVVMDGAETVGDEGGCDGDFSAALPPILEHPDKNEAGIASSE